MTTAPARPTNARLLATYIASLRKDVEPQYAQYASAFLTWLGNRPLDAKAVEDYIAKRRDQDEWSDGYLRLQWGTIRRLYLANGIAWPFGRGDAPVIREREEYRPALDPAVVIKMIETARTMRPSYYAAFLALSTTYGLRRTEMASMEPGNLRNGLVYVETAKHGRQRYHLCPEHVYPWIEKWGFKQAYSVAYLSRLFNDIKQASGMDRAAGKEIGWHGIRRILEIRLEEAGLSDRVRRSFLRWKSSGFGGIETRYSSSQIVGMEGRRTELSSSDDAIDTEVFAAHPFLEAWK